MGGQQIVNLSNLRGRQASEDIGEIFLGAQTSPSATDQDGIDHRAAPSRIRMTNEEPALAAYCCSPNVMFDQVVVDFKPLILKIPPQAVIFVHDIVHRLARRAPR